jgi:pimeloyl-ACP methyl ester carboxylesterase
VTAADRGVWHDASGPESARRVLLVHGSMDRSAGMLRLARQLDDEARVVRFDRRGYGRSTPHDGPFDMHEQVADAVAVMADHDDGRPWVLVGHSYGGNVVLSIAASDPDRVTGVAIYETPLSWEPWWPGSTAGAAAVAASNQPEQAAERFMRRIIGDARWEALPERTRLTRLAEGKAMVAELADLRAHRPWEADAITVPVLAGYGERGAPHHRAAMEHVVATLPDARLVQLDGCHHDAPMSDAPQFVTKMIRPQLG